MKNLSKIIVGLTLIGLITLNGINFDIIVLDPLYDLPFEH